VKRIVGRSAAVIIALHEKEVRMSLGPEDYEDLEKLILDYVGDYDCHCRHCMRQFHSEATSLFQFASDLLALAGAPTELYQRLYEWKPPTEGVDASDS
jgi:hypothetical protein